MDATLALRDAQINDAALRQWAANANDYIEGICSLLAEREIDDPLWQIDALTTGVRGLVEWNAEIERARQSPAEAT